MYRLPAEWEPQDGVLLAWPHAGSDWESCLDRVEPVYLELVRQISRFERVLIVTPQAEPLRDLLARHDLPAGRIRIEQLPTNDTWTRDFGPLTVVEQGRPRLLDFGFNGWGLKFASRYDNTVSRQLHQRGVFGTTPLQTSGLILEGGSIEVDGRGTLLTTSQCLLEANRNPQLTRGQLEAELGPLLGVRHWLWLEAGYLAGDDTDSHIDTLARLAPGDTLLYVRCDRPDDEHYPALQAMERQLVDLRTARGLPFRLLPLPWPDPVHDQSGQRLPATYANFLVINRAVLMPSYADPRDGEAREVIRNAYPDREVIPIDCRPLLEQHGSLHCITMQLPEGVLS